MSILSTSQNCYRKIQSYSVKILTSVPRSILTHIQCHPMEKFISIFHCYSSLTCFCNPRLFLWEGIKSTQAEGIPVSQTSIQIHITQEGKKARMKSESPLNSASDVLADTKEITFNASVSTPVIQGYYYCPTLSICEV